ncbi:hypothetical protein C6496_21350 [Candidatus Poribacteria bacterium]|nr:MAG: hypothetical protein C6496_21350 [Candidatus Poribacteria bacterium]
MQTQTERNTIPYAPRDTIYYPDTDGKPMAASDLHRDILIWILQALRHHFNNDVYVSGDILMYDKQGYPQSSISPDVLVAFGIGQQQRRTYKVWEEGKSPEFVMELSSENTYQNDLTRKMARYAGMGIQNYFLYDAEGRYLPAQLMGFTLVNGNYEAIAADVDGKIYSDALGLGFQLREDRLGIYDPETGEWLQTAAEAGAAAEVRAQNAEARAQQETDARRNAEAEVARLQEAVARLEEKRK